MHIIIYTYLTIVAIDIVYYKRQRPFLLACICIRAKSHLGGIDRGCHKITILMPRDMVYLLHIAAAAASLLEITGKA